MKPASFLLCTLFAFWSVNLCRAQDTCITLTGSVVLTSQAQLDLYWQQNPGICIDTIEGDLILAGDVVDISGFMGLRYIGGGILVPITISFSSNPSLRGLDSLREVDDFLYLNRQVYDIDALSNLRAVGENVDNQLSSGLTKSVTFGSGSYDNLDALSNLRLAHECKLSISNCDVRDASGLRNVSGLNSLFLGGAEIEIFPDLPYVDTLHRLMVNGVTGLSELSFSGLQYVNELYINDAVDLKSLIFTKPLYVGKRKSLPNDQYFDNNGSIVISGEIECLTAEFRRADSLEFLEVRISGLPLRPDCPAPDLSLLPINRLNYSGVPVDDTLELLFYPPNEQINWGESNLSKTNSRYGVEYSLIGLFGLKHLVIPDTGMHDILFQPSLENISIDTVANRGQIQGLTVDDCENLVHAQAFDQIKGSVNLYERNVAGGSARLDAASIEIIDCDNLQLRKTDFANVDSAWGIWLENLPATTELPSFANLKWVRQFGLKDMPINDDTLFSNETRVEHYLGITALTDDLSNGQLFINHNPLLDTFAFFDHNLRYSGILLNYNNSNLLVEGLNDVKTSGSLEIYNVNEQTNTTPQLLNNLAEVNSVLYQNIENTALPKIGNLDNLYGYAWLEDNGRWYTDQYNRTLKVDNALDISDATAVCPLVNSGNYELLDLDPSNSYPLHDAAALVSYCDSNRISNTSDLGQWKAFAAYPTINSAGGSMNFKGLENYTGTLHYRIISIDGKEVGQGNLVSGNYGRVDAISLPNAISEGQYFLDILDDKGRRGTSVIQIVMRP